MSDQPTATNESTESVITEQQENTQDSMTEALNNEQSNQETGSQSMSDFVQNGEENLQEAAPEVSEPINYEFKDKDGNLIQDNDEYLLNVKDISKDLNLSQDQAQKFFEQAKDRVSAINNKALEKLKNEWINSTIQDNEIGGANLNDARSNALKAIKDFGSNEFKELLINTGIIENPEVIRFLARVGKSTREDNNFIRGDQGTPPQQSFLRKMYKDSPELFEN